MDYLIVEYDDKLGIGENISKIFNNYDYTQYFIVRNGQKIIKTLDEYKKVSNSPPLNILAVSPKAKSREEILTKLTYKK